MGKIRTAWQTVESYRVNLSGLVRDGIVARGQVRSGTISWSTRGSLTGSASIETRWLGDGWDHITLSYTVTRADGSQTDYRERFVITTVPANIGRGEIPYLVCPRSGRRCRILYKAYGSEVFMSREAYLARGQRIYYPIQAASKLDRLNQRYWSLEARVEQDGKRRKALLYAGKPTRRMMRRKEMGMKLMEADDARMEFFYTWVERKVTG